MADHVVNRIILSGDKNRIHELLAAIKYDDKPVGTIDFRKVVPLPEYSGETLLSWLGSNWGTDRNSSPAEMTQEHILTFYTAWGRASPIVKALAEQYPDIEMEYQWTNEQIGSGTGFMQFRAGKMASETHLDDGCREAIELSAGLWGGTPENFGFAYNPETEGYERKQEETEQSADEGPEYAQG